jgi:hypothetical protein
MNFLLLSICLLISAFPGQNAKLIWSDCGSQQVKIYSMDFSPMPVIQPGTGVINFQGELLRDLNGLVNADLKISRSVGSITLPIRCYTTQGFQVGSCSYNDACKFLTDVVPQYFNRQRCPSELLKFGFDCTCPMKARGGNGDILEFKDKDLDIPDASKTLVSFLASGDFALNVKIGDGLGLFHYYSFLFNNNRN